MRALSRIVMAVGAMVWVAASTASSAAVQTTSTLTETKTFEVVAVYGNTLVVKGAEGTKELSVPDDFRFMVDGKPMAVSDLKAGMTGTATITTRTTVTPVVATEIKDGTVVHAAGSVIMVRTGDGVRSFTQGEVDKRGVKIVRDGKPAQLSDLHTGDRLTATIITTKPPIVVSEREVQATIAAASRGAAGPATPAAAPPAASTTPARPVESATPPVRKLPKTDAPGPSPSPLPLALPALSLSLSLSNVAANSAPPIAVLRIPRIGLEVPVLEGTDEQTLHRAVGHIEQTAAFGIEGNAGIAGHRTSFFRGLKQVGPGDVIEIETRGRTQAYRVERTWIVDPEDVSVLDPTPVRSLTLVTCYPFDFVGSAPRRFIVRAVVP